MLLYGHRYSHSPLFIGRGLFSMEINMKIKYTLIIGLVIINLFGTALADDFNNPMTPRVKIYIGYPPLHDEFH